MTRVFFVRHAQPLHEHSDDRTRPLTEEGIKDSRIVINALNNVTIDAIYCSPYKRSRDTVKPLAESRNLVIHTDERLREREKGPDSNHYGMFQKRWADHTYHEEGGESIQMVQARNIEALTEILSISNGKNVVIGTHGTALSSILNYYRPEFGCDDFLRIIDWMPYVLELDFNGQSLISVNEIAYIEKEFKGNNRADVAEAERNTPDGFCVARL